MLEYLLSHVSYLGIFLALALTGIGLPIPEELIVIAAGWGAFKGVLEEPWLALAACIGGAIIGDALMYAVGYHFGHRILRHRLFFGRSPTVRMQREERAERMIQQHGLKVLFVARFLVGLRSMVYLAAGIMRMPFRRFILVEVASASTVIGIVFGLSYRYASHIDNLWQWIRTAEWTLTVALVAGIVALLLLARRRHRRRVLRVQRRKLERLRRSGGVILTAPPATGRQAEQPVGRTEPIA